MCWAGHRACAHTHWRFTRRSRPARQTGLWKLHLNTLQIQESVRFNLSLSQYRMFAMRSPHWSWVSFERLFRVTALRLVILTQLRPVDRNRRWEICYDSVCVAIETRKHLKRWENSNGHCVNWPLPTLRWHRTRVCAHLSQVLFIVIEAIHAVA